MITSDFIHSAAYLVMPAYMTMPYLCYLHLGFWKYVKIKDHPLIILHTQRHYLQKIPPM